MRLSSQNPGDLKALIQRQEEELIHLREEVEFLKEGKKLVIWKHREAAARIEQLEAALREMAQEDGTNARRMRAAIVAARAKLTISRPHWTGPILQADGILAQALTVAIARAALGEEP